MHFHWGGDVIFRDTLLPNKRFVIGSPDEPVATDIREWLRPAESRVMVETLARIPCLPRAKRPGDYDRRALRIWGWVAAQVRYDYDRDRRGYDDFWLFAEESLSLGVGDCEDSSILLYRLLVAAGISPYCVRMALGHLYGGGQLIGSHAWVVYQDEIGIWRLLESTLDQMPLTLPDADALTVAEAPLAYCPDFCVNEHHLWWIRPPAFPGIHPPLGLDDYLRRRFESGVVNAEMTPERRRQIHDYCCRR